MIRGLVWRKRSQTRYTISRAGEDVAEVVQEMTSAGPRWFAKIKPMNALCAPGECATFKEAAAALLQSADDGDF